MNNIYSELPGPFFVLAPMDDVTDTVFRQIVADLGAPDLYFTEFVNVDALNSSGHNAAMIKLRFTENERPIIAQIWGKSPENYYKSAAQLVDMGFDGIDINMGCPDKTIVKNGCCSALINNRELAGEIITAVKDGAAGKVPVSVKTRVGYDQVDLSWIEFLLEQNLDALTIHGRTRAQMSKVPADWGLIGKAREMRDKVSPNTVLIGNGDVESRQQGLALAEQHQLDGIMIGRGIFHDPLIFSKDGSRKWEEYGLAEKKRMYAKHVKLFAETWKDNERNIRALNKFCKVYINGFDGAKEMRDKLMHAKDTNELLNLLT